ncbi:MAG: ABC transporter permease subunit [Methylobacteriaceae bacterium]|jgi:polar amino acid transport system permease protein/octopine/nopaline transport system permease protein|nr:ABC transporter permease subunit [Methylobacteriaceae bacterium]
MIDSLTIAMDMMPRIAAAAPLTIFLTVASAILGFSIGIPVAFARLSANKLVMAPAEAFSLFFRGTPALVQIYLIYYGLGQVLPGTWLRHSFLWPYLREGLWYAVLALSLNQAAYVSEVFRGAVKNLHRGYIQAGQSLGMTPGQITRMVVIPLALRDCLPVLTSETLFLLKTTSLASTITVMEIMGTARALQRTTYNIYEPLFCAAILYFAITFVLIWSMKQVELRINAYRLVK